MEKTSISTNEIKRIKSLSMKKNRDEFGTFIVEGEKMVSEAVKSDFEVIDIYREENIGKEAMSRISQLSSPSPVLAIVRKPADVELEDADSSTIQSIISKGGLFLALDSIRDPGNLGTILRISDWFGIDAIFAAPDTVDLFNPKVVQATMGAIFRVKFHYCSIPTLCKEVLKAGGNVYGTFLDGEDFYTKTLSTGDTTPSLIIIGNESNGISPEVEALVSDKLYIPPYPADQPGSESLNAAVATAITINEFRRQGRK